MIMPIIKDKTNLIRILAFLQTLFFVLSSFALAKTQCDVPSKLIRITVRVATISPHTYIYTVTNLYESPIINFKLGTTDHAKMRIMPDNTPKSVGSPQGWEGEHVFLEESHYMHIFWNVKENQSAIAQNTSRTGFKLVMPEPIKTEKQLYAEDGTPSVPHDMKKTSFQVRFKDGRCVWGKVQVE